MSASPATAYPVLPSTSFGRSKDEADDDWAHFEDPDEIVSQDITPEGFSTGCNRPPLEFALLPPQLHPAVSLGFERVSSCYFSLGSERENSVADLLSQFGDDSASVTSSGNENAKIRVPYHHHMGDGVADVLYHDILMHVFTFLDAPSMTAFSETARRPNFEVFYFLQLQLQRALLVASQQENPEAEVDSKNVGHHHAVHAGRQDSLSAIAGSSCLSRLAQLDMTQAQNVVEEYLQSNSTLRTMPLSHSLAYFRHALLQRNGLFFRKPGTGDAPGQALASVALLVTVVGAAVMSGSADAAAFTDSFGGELPNMLFRAGCVGSALMATRKMSNAEAASSDNYNTNKDEPNTMRERAEQMARALQELPATLMRQEMPGQFRFPSLMELRQTLHDTLSGSSNRKQGLSNDPNTVVSSNPYDHLPMIDEKKEQEEFGEDFPSPQLTQAPKMPSGSMGAYSRAIQKAACAVTEIIKQRRKSRFLALPPDEQRQLSLAFLDACSSDDNLTLVKEMVHSMDVDGFFVGSDGSETCALHTAAFHGAAKVLDYLCQGIDYGDSADSSSWEPQDGGLCNIDARDSNGWTALHFAAGANAVTAAEILASNGAQLAVEANNGYTPLQWAQRLSNEQVSERLKELLAEQGATSNTWLPSRPLSQIANRFFSLMPSS